MPNKTRTAPLRKRFGRAMEAATMAGLRSYFVVGERLYPGRAARDAVNLWMRVPPAPPVAKRDRGLASGEPLEIRVNGRSINAMSWGEGPIVLCAHGWNAWWRQYSLHIPALVDAGLRVVAWDAPGHGDSQPGQYGVGRSGMPDVADAIRAVAASVGDGHVHGIIAHSGATLAACHALASGTGFDRAVFISTSISATHQVEYYADRLGWGPDTVRRARERIARIFGVDFDEWEMDPRLAGMDLAWPKLLMIHQRDDQQTPLRGAERLTELWPESRLIVTDDLDHHRLLWATSTVKQAVDFLRP